MQKNNIINKIGYQNDSLHPTYTHLKLMFEEKKNGSYI